MNFRPCLALLWIVFAPAAANGATPAGELVSLPDEEFMEKADEGSYSCTGDNCPYTMPELITIAARLAPGVRDMRTRLDDGNSFNVNPFGNYFEAACRRADDSQLGALINIYSRLDPGSFERSRVLPWLAARCLQRETKAIRSEHLQAKVDSAEPQLPAQLQRASDDLQRAWRFYRRAVHAYDAAFPSERDKEQIDAYANQKSFYGLIDAALGGAESVGDELSKYGDFSAGCMNVRDIDDGKEIGTLIALLHGRKVDEAVGAVLKVASSTGSTSSPDAFVEPAIDFLRAVGLDWERLFVGAIADATLQKWSLNDRVPLLDALAQLGSERGALLVLELTELAKEEDRAALMGAFDRWVQTPDKPVLCHDEGITTYRVGAGERKAPVSPATHSAVLRTTKKLAAHDCPTPIALAALNVFSRAATSEVIPAVKVLATHDSPEVVEKAQKILCALGIEPPESKGGGPAKYHILVNGNPLPEGAKIGWFVGSESTGRSSSAEVKRDGTIELDRSLFTNPKATPTIVVLTGSGRNDPTEVDFSAETSAPKSLDDVTDVTVETIPLEIRLKNLESLNGSAPTTARITLTPTGHLSYLAGRFADEKEFPADKPITFPQIQAGVHRLTIAVTGSELWEGEVRVAPAQPPLEIALKPGSDLTFRLLAPDHHRVYGAQLLKEGKQAERRLISENDTYRSLGCGEYVLRVFGSSQFARRQGRTIVPGPDELPSAGRDVTVHIDEHSPAVIDLGEIQLDAQ